MAKLPHVSDVPNAVWAWLEKKKVTYDANLYTPEAWAARGETYGQGSLFTITSEGPLNHIINDPQGRADMKFIQDFGAFLGKLGIYYEQGFSWSLHFYPLG
jgi:hypothetical protein